MLSKLKAWFSYWILGQKPDFKQVLESMVKSLERGEYQSDGMKLIQGANLPVEDIELRILGLYTEKDPSVPDSDYILTIHKSFGRPVWKRRSEEGTKWFEPDEPLTSGGPLVVEDLDTSGMGLYHEKDPNVPDDDYFDSGWRSFGRILWQRKSEEGVKWHVYEDKEIKLHQLLVSKDKK
jgi:hypothetical protein